MSAVVKVQIEDDAYVKTQTLIQTLSRLLLDPKAGVGQPTLDLFIERAERSLSVGPVLHPSEYLAGAEKLHQIIECAKALRDAQRRISEVTGR